jgi:hypothetical protein
MGEPPWSYPTARSGLAFAREPWRPPQHYAQVDCEFLELIEENFTPGRTPPDMQFVHPTSTTRAGRRRVQPPTNALGIQFWLLADRTPQRAQQKGGPKAVFALADKSCVQAASSGDRSRVARYRPLASKAPSVSHSTRCSITARAPSRVVGGVFMIASNAASAARAAYSNAESSSTLISSKRRRRPCEPRQGRDSGQAALLWQSQGRQR